MEEFKFSWNVGETTLTYSHPSVTFFPSISGEDIASINQDAIMYYYYTLTLESQGIRKEFRTHDFPKVLMLPAAIEKLITADLKATGVVLDEIKQDDFHRIERYKRLRLDDGVGYMMEYFIQLERYDYEVKQPDTETYQVFSEYRILIGEPFQPHKEDHAADCLYLYELGVEDLHRLKEVAEAFIQYSIKVEMDREKEESLK